MKFSIKDFFSKCDEIRSFADLVTFSEEILNGKCHFLCSFCISFYSDEIHRFTDNPAHKFLFKVNNRSSRKICEIFSKLTIQTPELVLELVTRTRYGIFLVNFEHISHHIFSVSIVDFAQINVFWEWPLSKYLYSVQMLENMYQEY